MVEVEGEHGIEALYIWLLVDDELGVAIFDVLDGGGNQVPAAGDDLAFQAQVADYHAVGLGVGIYADDGLGIGVRDEIGFEGRSADGQVWAGLQHGVINVRFIQNRSYASQALGQGGVPQVLNADGYFAAGADMVNEGLGQDAACTVVALAYIRQAGVVWACIGVGPDYRNTGFQG